MFKKIVSQIGFSPASVEQLARYAQSVRRRQHLHGWAILVLALFIVILITIAFLPHNHTTTPTVNDLIPGGILSASDAIEAFDLNTNDFRNVADLLEISRDDIAQADQASCDDLLSPTLFRTGILPDISSNQDSRLSYRLSDGSPIYLQEIDKVTQNDGWCGTTEAGQNFMISAIDGNIVTSELPTSEPIGQQLSLSHKADTNLLRAGQIATWTLTVSNQTDQIVTEPVWMPIGDIVEYAGIISISDDGLVSSNQSHILWPEINLNPGESYQLNVVAQAPQLFDETPRQIHTPGSYDCQIDTIFGESNTMAVDCPLIKQTESTLHQLPPVGLLTNLAIFVVLFIANLITYLSLRTKSNELRLIRRQMNTGSF